VDFSPGAAEQAVTSAAAAVLGDDRSAGDKTMWRKLAASGLLSLAAPEWLGGDGLGVLETAALLTEVGRSAAQIPALGTLMLGVLPVVRWGERETQRALLDGVAAGETVLTAAIREPSDPRPLAPATTATLPCLPSASAGPGDTSGVLGVVTGVKIGVASCAEARWVLVPARLASGGAAIVVVDPSGDGATVTAGPTASGTPEYTLRLDQAPVRHVLGGPGGRAVLDLYQLAAAGACCLADGAVSAALDLTITHVAQRRQFGRPLATFQAVAQQVADVYIAARTLHLATLSGCWRLADGRDAAADLDVAAYWLTQYAPAALRTCHHLHGGMGMDVSYPLHRYSALISDLVRFTGGADYRLGVLGDRVCEAGHAP
jgi:alkylation response protein AidB-like acyl-CoA dehydrogenase